MYTTNAEIIVEAKDIWKYHKEHRLELVDDMVVVAANEDFDVTIYLTDDSGTPCLIIESSNVESREFYAETEDDCKTVAEKVYNDYLTDNILNVLAEEEMEADLDLESAISEREADIDSFFERLFQDLLEDDPILYSEESAAILEDCKEHMLEYMYRKHGISVYRPMELEDDEGVFFEDYPYESMEFDPNPLYDDFKVTDLNIDGKDLIALGIPQGKEIGNMLEIIRRFVIGNVLPNDHDKIIEYIKSIKKTTSS